VKKFVVTLCMCLAMIPGVLFAQALDNYIELLRSDIRTEKTEILTEALKLTEAQTATFWPIQREYETELAKIQDARIAMIKDYAKSYDTMDEAKAKELMETAFKLQEQRNSLLKKYAGKVSKEVSPTVAVRFAQVESLIHALIDVQVRSEIPLAP
jgi:hypothetical protein